MEEQRWHPWRWEGQVLCKGGGWSVNVGFFFGISFLFGEFVILTETNAGGKNILVRKQKLHLL